MNLTNSAVALSVALATGLVFADSNALEPFEKLNLDNGAQWFAAPSTGGNWSATPSAGETQGYLEVDSDSAQPLTFTISAELGEANVISDISLGMIASPVPASVTLAIPESPTKVGFAIKKTDATTSKYMAYLGGESWTELSGTPVSEGAACTLKIQLDRRQTPTKVRFLVNDVAVGGWNELVGTIGTTAAIDFVGSGEIKELKGMKYTITSETITVTPGSGSGSMEVVIPEAMITKLRKTIGNDDVGAKLSESASGATTGLNKLDSYVLFSKDSTEKVQVKGASAATATSGNVAVKVAGLDILAKTTSGATVKCRLLGCATADGEFAPVGEAVEVTGKDPVIEFPQNTTHRFFKVQTTIDYTKKASN